jgi:organic radical activating enzyme
MELGEIEKAIKSLDGYSGNIGLMGGEPAMHPRFLGILELYRDLIPDKNRRQFWTSGWKWGEYKDEIHRTFHAENISFNDHSKLHSGRHQPLLVAIDEVVEDKALMRKFIDNCWVQNRWSASINTNGAFVCEVAAAMSYLVDNYWALGVEKDWWRIKPNDFFEDMVFSFCKHCSGCLPVSKHYTSHAPYSLISPGNIERYKFNQDRVDVAHIDLCKAYIFGTSAEPGEEPGSLRDFPDWAPWNYRDEVFHEPGEGEMTVTQIRKLQKDEK